jgi:glycosyltransferase involved in cell wall biosynthesis
MMFSDLSTKNILYLTHDYYSFTKDQIEIIAENFQQVYVLVRYKPIAELGNILPINYFKNHRKKIVFDLTDKPKNVTVIPTPLYYLPTDSGYQKLGEGHLRKVLKSVKKLDIKFDIIHSHFTWTAGYVGAQLKKMFRKPFIITAHGYDVYELPFQSPVWNKAITQVLNAADQILTVSVNNQRCIEKLSVDAHSRVIYNGFNSAIFRPIDQAECRAKLNLPVDKKIILTVAPLQEIKGQHILIEAIKKILAQQNDFLCLLVGDGEYRKKLEDLVIKFNLKEYVQLVGWKPHNEITYYMNASDVIVLPSFCEGNPTVMFEALGCGKPFVGTKVGGIPEIIISDDYGLLVEKGNSDDLAERLVFALGKKWDWSRIHRYAQNFTWQNIGKQIQAVYQSLL